MTHVQIDNAEWLSEGMDCTIVITTEDGPWVFRTHIQTPRNPGMATPDSLDSHVQRLWWEPPQDVPWHEWEGYWDDQVERVMGIWEATVWQLWEILRGMLAQAASRVAMFEQDVA